MSIKLYCHERFELGERQGLSRMIDVIDDRGSPVHRFDLMCAAIDSDVLGEEYLEWPRKVEKGETSYVEVDGNGWVTHLTPEAVWFEGLYSQGEGGAVSFKQYKFAVETYVRFLSDPEHRSLEVEFPAD